MILELSNLYPRIKPLLLKKNGKVSAARNAGLAVAKGEYVTFVDADDYYYSSEKLENEMTLIKKYAQDGIDVCAYSSIVRVSNDGSTYSYPTAGKKRYLEGDIYKRLLLDVRSSMVMRDYCIKTELVRSAGGYTIGNSLYEDFELTVKIAENTPFYYTGEYGTAYRDSISGLSHKPYNVLVKAKNDIIGKQIESSPFLFRLEIKLKRKIIGLLKRIRRVFFISSKRAV